MLMRYRTNAKIIVGDKIMKVRELDERYPTRSSSEAVLVRSWGSARWYSKLECYVRRLKVAIPKVGAVDLRTDSLELIVWKWQSRGWQLTALVSTIEGGVQEVMRAWKSRWSLEVSHRIRTRSSCPVVPAWAGHRPLASRSGRGCGLLRVVVHGPQGSVRP